MTVRTRRHPAVGSTRSPRPATPSVRPVRLPRRARDEVGGHFALHRWRLWVPITNVTAVVVGGAMHSWVRELKVAAPAIASLWIVLIAAGLFSAAGVAVQTAANAELASAAVIRIYLNEGATPDQVSALTTVLSKRSDVRSVDYISKENALAEARSRPGLSELASLADGNPFPASLQVHVASLADMDVVAASATSDTAVDQTHPTSFDPDVYARLRRAVMWGWMICGGAVVILLVIGVLIISSAMRSVVIARRAELHSMNLVGAPPWLLRSRLTFEGLLSGALAGALAALVLLGFYDGAAFLDPQSLTYALPGVSPAVAGSIALAALAAGAGISVITSASAFRRSLR